MLKTLLDDLHCIHDVLAAAANIAEDLIEEVDCGEGEIVVRLGRNFRRKG